MAWVLRLDGVNDYPNFTPVSLAAGDSLSFNYIATDSAGANNNYFVDGTNSGNRPYLFIYNGKLEFNASFIDVSLDDTPITTKQTAPPQDGLQHKLTLTVKNNCVFGRFANRYTSEAYMKLDLIDLTIVKLNSDFLLWDATASDHSNTGAQPVLTDTVGTNDATGVNFPTDGSAWVDLGGGGNNFKAAWAINSNAILQ